jgi:hypothetical protein
MTHAITWDHSDCEYTGTGTVKSEPPGGDS